MNHRRLLREVLCSKDTVINWCQSVGLIKTNRECGKCNGAMKLKKKGSKLIRILSVYVFGKVLQFINGCNFKARQMVSFGCVGKKVLTTKNR